MHRIKYIFKSPLLYKILVDIFLLFIIAVVFLLVLETVIPGIITMYVSPLTLFSILFIFIWLIAKLSHGIPSTAHITSHSKIMLILTTLFFALLIGIAGFRYDFFFGGIVVIFSITIFMLLHHLVKDMLRD